MRVRRAEPGDEYGDIAVDTNKSHRVYEKWLEYTRTAERYSPDGTRRPYWLLRPVRPQREAYRLPEPAEPSGGASREGNDLRAP